MIHASISRDLQLRTDTNLCALGLCKLDTLDDAVGVSLEIEGPLAQGTGSNCDEVAHDENGYRAA